MERPKDAIERLSDECSFMKEAGEIGLSSDIVRIIAWIKYLEDTHEYNNSKSKNT